jgi:hypothetical protein
MNLMVLKGQKIEDITEARIQLPYCNVPFF